MHKRWMRLAAVLTAVCLSFPPAGAVNAKRGGETMIRVGLASSSSHVPQGELEAAHLENNDGYGSGYRFGYYDSNLNFIELARTDADTTQIAVLKTQNLYYGYSSQLNKTTYSSTSSGDIMVGCYHLLMNDRPRSYEEAQAEAAQYSDGFVAWIDGSYQVRSGSYASKEEAEAALAGEPEALDVVGTSSYAMSVVETGTSHILFQYDEGSEGKLGIQPDVTGKQETRTWFSGLKYRGGFQYHRRNGGNLTVVNVLGLEDYVNGVICYEMGREWPLEALKSQALCARTYALGSLGKHSSYGFDICNSASCQVYNGMGSNRSDYGPSATSMQAVAETEGQVILYRGQLAEVAYSSSLGGASEDAANVWGTDTVNYAPYLCGVVDPYEADLDDRNSQSPWTVTYTATQLTQRLQSLGLGNNTSLDCLELNYSELGNVIEVVIHWANGQTSSIYPSGSKAIRGVFGLNSIRFTVNGQTADGASQSTPTQPSGGGLLVNGAPVEDLNGMYTISGSGDVGKVGEDAYTISGSGAVASVEDGQSGNSGSGSGNSGSNQGGGTVIVSGNTYVFEGRGYGHQLGMSQYGANAMARRGFTCEEIVTFYLPGVQVGYYN